jgi:signal transduction histidine kinase
MVRALFGPVRGVGAGGGLVVDLVIGVAVAALLVLVTGHLSGGDGRSVDGFGYVLVVVAGLVLVFWRRAPRLVLGVVIVVVGCYVAGQYPNGPVLAVGLIALLSLSWQTDRRTTMVGASALCVVLGVAGAVAGGSAAVLGLFFLGWSAAAVLLGEALRNRRSYLRELQDRARMLEQSRNEEGRRRVAEDRLRIARDLHDGVAHAMATINVQAGAAAHVIDQRPLAARDALVAIRQASGEVLDELAAMLRVLREDDAAATRAPRPGLEQIAALVETTRGAGLPVALVIDGPTAVVPRSVGTAAYRIVQESLTNVLRHADARTARVHVRAGEDRSLTVEVCDDGTGTAPGSSVSAGAGVGIPGMLERARSSGGQLEAGESPSGGFVVRASWDAHP